MLFFPFSTTLNVLILRYCYKDIGDSDKTERGDWINFMLQQLQFHCNFMSSLQLDWLINFMFQQLLESRLCMPLHCSKCCGNCLSREKRGYMI